MAKKYKKLFVGALLVIVVFLAGWDVSRKNIPILQPKGTIGLQERSLIITASLLALIVVIPVFVMLFAFSWRYREGNKKSRYSPDLAGNRGAEAVWWIIPSIIIVILSIITWNSSHSLDPYRPISSTTPALTVQVVALDWKWLFIYPKQHVASVNFLELPVNTPVHFDITSDTVMNSFWIPALGGQIYAMPGMATQLNLMASVPGSYNGSSANISGEGFAGMTFVTKADSTNAFNGWATSVQKSSNSLTSSAYTALASAHQISPVIYYRSAPATLFNSIIGKYMNPGMGI